MWLEWSVVALTVSLIAAIATWTGWTARADNLFYDVNMQLAPADAPDDIVIVAIDETSLEQYGRWPWPRHRHTQLLGELTEAKPRAAALDILFTEPSNADDDAKFAQAIAAFSDHAPLAIPSQLAAPGRNGQRFDLIPPVTALAQAANATGHVNTPIDTDGSVRRTFLCLTKDGTNGRVPHLIKSLWLADGQNERKLWPECERPSMPRFAAPGGFTTISYASVANGHVPAAFFKDRFVLVGVTAQGLGDQYNVPSSISFLMPGVEINANILGSVIRDDFIATAPFWLRLMFGLFPVWILLTLLWRMKPWQVIMCVGALGATVLITSLALLPLGIWLAPTPALSAIALVYPLWGWRRLQATSDYMESELQTIDKNAGPLPPPTRNFEAADIVTLQAERLNLAITELRDLQRLVTNSLRSLPDPTLVADPEGEILLSNRAADIFDRDDLAGKQIMTILEEFAARSDWPRVEGFLQQRYADEPQNDDSISSPPYVSFLNRHGRCFAMRCSSLFTAQGDLRGHIFYLADITEITNAQNEREEMIEFLSHDMRAPQAAILTLLGQSNHKNMTETKDRIARHARHTLSLADSFVDMARMKSDAFEPEPILLGDLVSEAMDSVWPLANARKITLELTNNIGENFVLGEHNGLFRAIANLLDNAVKYSPDNSVINIGLSRLDLGNEPNVRIEISDSGPGVAQDILAQLFTKFKNTDENSLGTIKGIGLGLYYTAMVIRRHGGEISIENRKQGGTNVLVILPLDETDSAS